ncbi:hypothetical protein Dvina_04255 [Dactylosporangium vinaceum]|uniref:Uncharacterized protein n=1 Tax=Dactylosporangium vinaceum TaxID=53362 RepID=A0ABV5M0E8_9ACTN|nr:hypothetical protein [Dactylosporangium vinaceum]UAB97398.1 hypothetical protein Dvina_04255 [Dactylosporangium vinaceum]
MTRQWTARPAPPVPYRPHQRLADWFHGFRDGHKHLPVVVADGEPVTDPVVTTPTIAALRHRAADQIEAERLLFLGQRQALAAAEQEAAADLGAARRRLDEATLKLDQSSVPLDDKDLLERRTAEGDRSDALVRQRRLAEHTKAAAKALREHANASKEHDRLVQQLGELQATLPLLHDVAASRVRRINEHALRRINAYWRQLVLSHPDGPRLNTELAVAGPDLPDWARDRPLPPGGA